MLRGGKSKKRDQEGGCATITGLNQGQKSVM
jgi:hypothetical protein